MSKLEELIEELCPDGVEFIELDNLCKRGPKSPYGTNQVSEMQEGTVLCFTSGSKEYMVDTTLVRGENVFINDGGVADIKYYNGDACYTDHVLCISADKRIKAKYLYYYLSEKKQHIDDKLFKGSGLKNLNKKEFFKLLIPVPDLKIQCEIIRILDNFTELTAELTAELIARNKQYKAYSKRIIDEAKNITYIKIKDLGNWSGGSTPSTKNSDFWNNGTIPWISSKDMKSFVMIDTEDHITENALENTSLKLYPENVVAIVARSGILRHTLPICYIPFRTTVNQDIKVLITNKNIISKFVAYTFRAYHDELLLKTKKQGGTVDSLEMSKFMEFEIPIPSIDEQERIINLLDKFSALCDSISEGLPAEIDARQKQYEYYRSKLLSFKEKVG